MKAAGKKNHDIFSEEKNIALLSKAPVDAMEWEGKWINEVINYWKRE